MEGLIFSVSGARGIVGQGIDPLVVTGIAAHFGAWARDAAGLAAGADGAVVAVGRDSRVSGEMMLAAVTAGLVGSGCTVVDLGIVSTPTVEVAIRELGACAGIQISASHNPAHWNALKLLSSRGIFLTETEGASLRARMDAGPPAFQRWDALGRTESRPDFSSRHIDRILASPLVDADAVRAAKLSAVVDCVNGAGGAIAKELLERLGVSAAFLNAEPTGRFPRNPEPLPENLGELGAAVPAKGAHIGFALDPDADRVAVVDQTGRPIGEEVTLAVVVDSVLPLVGGDVVVNVSTTMAIDAVAARHGSRVRRTKVGEVNVTEEMLRCGAQIGGEGNGGVIVPAVNPGRDGLLGIALWLTALAREGATASDLAGRIPATVMRKEKIEVEGVDVDLVLESLERAFPAATVDRTDGLKLLVDGGWVHVRKSNTEPILRILAEAESAGAVDDLVARAREAVRGTAAGKPA